MNEDELHLDVLCKFPGEKFKECLVTLKKKEDFNEDERKILIDNNHHFIDYFFLPLEFKEKGKTYLEKKGWGVYESSVPKGLNNNRLIYCYVFHPVKDDKLDKFVFSARYKIVGFDEKSSRERSKSPLLPKFKRPEAPTVPHTLKTKRQSSPRRSKPPEIPLPPQQQTQPKQTKKKPLSPPKQQPNKTKKKSPSPPKKTKSPSSTSILSTKTNSPRGEVEIKFPVGSNFTNGTGSIRTGDLSKGSSWSVSTEAPSDRSFGSDVTGRISRGSFGSVLTGDGSRGSFGSIRTGGTSRQSSGSVSTYRGRPRSASRSPKSSKGKGRINSSTSKSKRQSPKRNSSTSKPKKQVSRKENPKGRTSRSSSKSSKGSDSTLSFNLSSSGESNSSKGSDIKMLSRGKTRFKLV